jgi:hypothetical protein
MEYINRYGNKFTFEKTDDGNILWKGNFEHCKIGIPNEYREAYYQYVYDNKHVQNLMSFNQFKDVVHEYDDETHKYIYDKYLKLVLPIPDKISMVDPGGGPYLSEGMNLKVLDKSYNKMIIKEFERHPEGIIIIINK